jgi:hypothetical protein
VKVNADPALTAVAARPEIDVGWLAGAAATAGGLVTVIENVLVVTNPYQLREPERNVAVGTDFAAISHCYV